ncbi:hypothetical protein F0562_026945 [Nyssa sinensis]|uniref:SB domain-containing protein n=1 Tax=Nyssa sinensis TaxID=561372 RepID=A0A5J5B3Z9_9ASTE|nr:hypothetical protein F0562_026945 [Nyssa sinensis]
MFFQQVTYNIPVVIWLMESYPRHPPLVFVNPTRDMIIKRPHAYVDPSVQIQWCLRTRCQWGLQGIARPAIPPRVYPQSPYGSSGGRIPPPSPQRPLAVTEDPSDVFKRNAINKLVESLHSDIGALRKTRETEMEGLFNAQAVLRQREEQLSKGLREMQDEKEGLEQQLQMVLMNTDILEGWLRENKGKMANMGNVNVDDAFEPCDALSKQMLECTASDLAIEDVIYSLDKAVQEGSIPTDQYLRNVRLLSREQFFHRATSSKVRAAQMQAQVTSMANRASQYVV